MKIKFTPKLITGLTVYLGISLKEIASNTDFPYSKIYLYKVSSSELPVNKKVNDFFNSLWNELGLNMEDLTRIYQLSEILEAGQIKYKKYKLKDGSQPQGGK